MKPLILIVEDEFIIALDLQQKILSLGYNAPVIAANGIDAVQLVKELKPDLVLMDIVLAGPIDGIEAAERIKEFSSVPIIYTTSYSDRKILDRAKKTNAYAYVTKPYEVKDLVIAIEISIARYRADHMVLESEKRFRRIVESSKDAFFVFDQLGNIHDTNQQASVFLACDKQKILSTKIYDLLNFQSDAFSSMLDSLLNQNYPLTFEGELVRGAKQKISAEFRVAIFDQQLENPKFLALCRDITERKNAEQEKQDMFLQLAHSSKLATLGTMSASVVHELKNPLTAILGFTDMLLNRSDLPPFIEGKLAFVKTAAKKMDSYVNHLKNYSRQDQIEDMREVDINQAIENAWILLRPQFHSIDVNFDQDSQLPKIFGNINQVESLIQNFLVNSFDAFQEHQNIIKPTISIQTKVKNNEIALIFEDNAGGIPPELCGKIFEPFFTTKPFGKGTGLGLSIVKYIMEMHRGSLTIEMSKDSQGQALGTIFEISFPRLEAFADVPQDRKTIINQSLDLKKPQILLVDDDPSITELLQNILCEYFDVTIFNDSEEAIRNIQTSRFDVIVTDLHMPKKSGEELIHFVDQQQHKTPVFVVTGVHVDRTQSPYKSVQGFIEKPIMQYENMVDQLRQALTKN